MSFLTSYTLWPLKGQRELRRAFLVFARPEWSCPIGLRIGPKRTDAPILRRLRSHPLPKEGGSGSPSCSTGDTRGNPVTLTSYSSPPKAAIPQPSGQRPVKLENPPVKGPSTLSAEGAEPAPPAQPLFQKSTQCYIISKKNALLFYLLSTNFTEPLHSCGTMDLTVCAFFTEDTHV